MTSPVNTTNTTATQNETATGDAQRDPAEELPGMTAERVRSIVAVIVTTYALVQSILAARGINPLPFTSDQVSTAVFAVIGLAGSIYNWWTHNAVTIEAYKGKLLTQSLKLDKHAGDDKAGE